MAPASRIAVPGGVRGPGRLGGHGGHAGRHHAAIFGGASQGRWRENFRHLPDDSATCRQMSMDGLALGYSEPMQFGTLVTVAFGQVLGTATSIAQGSYSVFDAFRITLRSLDQAFSL